MFKKVSLILSILILASCGNEAPVEQPPELLGTWGEIEQQDQMTFMEYNEFSISMERNGVSQELSGTYTKLSDGVKVDLMGQEIKFRFSGQKLCQVNKKGIVLSGVKHCAAKVKPLT